jgi:hypothetical protein
MQSVLSVMHNWLEGVLQDFARYVLGIGGLFPDSQGNQSDDETVPAEDWMDIDSSEIDKVLSALDAESLAQDTPSHTKRQHSQTPSAAASDNSNSTVNL